LGFLSATVTVTITAGQSIYVVSSASLGTTNTNGAHFLDLYVCYQAGSGPIQTVGIGEFGLSVPNAMRTSFELSAVITGLPAGTYTVGLGGQTENGNTDWNSNDAGYTTALVLNS
jgi:hypothetical protein